MKRKTGSCFLIGLAIVLLLAAAAGARIAIAARQVARANAAQDISGTLDIGSTPTLTILPLFEKGKPAQDGLVTGHGVSYLITTGSGTYLLDAGNTTAESSSPLEANRAALGIALEDIDALVISHNHMDHVGGSQWWRSGTFSLGAEQSPLPFAQVFVPVKLSYPGIEPQVARQPVILGEGIATMGTLPFLNPFPFSLWQPVTDEQSLVVNVEGKGIVIITGCGHPGLEPIVARAEALFAQPVIGVVGGLHYGTATAEQIQPHITFLAQRSPQLVALSPHDSEAPARSAFQTAFPGAYQQIQVGQPVVFP